MARPACASCGSWKRRANQSSSKDAWWSSSLPPRWDRWSAPSPPTATATGITHERQASRSWTWSPSTATSKNVLAAFKTAVQQGRFVGGPMVEGFERDFADFCELVSASEWRTARTHSAWP